MDLPDAPRPSASSFSRLSALFAKAPLWIYCVLVFCVAVAVRIHWIGEKEAFHCDEQLSVMLCSENRLENLVWGKVYSGREAKEIVYGNERGGKELAADLYSLRENNHDLCHTNVYYSLLRLALFNADSADMRTVILRGFVLNLVLFSFAFVFFALFLREIFGAKKLPIVASLTAGALVPAMISMSVFLRPYELWFAVISLFAFVCARCAKNYLRRGNTLFSWKNLWLLSGTVAVTLLGVYFSIVVVVFAGIFLCALAWKKARRRELPFLGSVFALALVFATAIYPNYPVGFLSGRGTEAARKFSFSQIFDNIGNSFSGGVNILLSDALALPCVALLLVAGTVALFERRRLLQGKTEPHPALAGTPTTRLRSFVASLPASDVAFVGIFGAMLLSFCAIMYLAPYKNVRYVCALVPFLLVLVPWVFSKLHARKIAIAGTLCFVAVFVGGTGFATPNPMFGKTTYNHHNTVALLKPKIRHLIYSDDAKNYVSLKKLSEKNLPLVFVRDWRLSGIDLMTMSDSAQCTFIRPDKEKQGAVVVPANKPATRGKFIFVFPMWGIGPSASPMEVVFPRGHLGEEFRLSSPAVAFEFSADNSAPPPRIVLNAKRASQGGKYFDVVPAETPEK